MAIWGVYPIFRHAQISCVWLRIPLHPIISPLLKYVCIYIYMYTYIHTVQNIQCLCCTSTLWTDSHNSGIPCLIADRQVLRIQELGSLVQFRHLARFHKTMLRAEVLRDAVSSVFFYVYYIYIYPYLVSTMGMGNPLKISTVSRSIRKIINLNGEFSSHFWWSQWPPGSPKKSVACRLILRSSNWWGANLLAVFSREIAILRFQSRLFPETSGNLSYTSRKNNMQTA